MRAEQGAILEQLAKRWGSLVIHVWDRGFAGTPWLFRALAARVRFIVRSLPRWGVWGHPARVSLPANENPIADGQ